MLFTRFILFNYLLGALLVDLGRKEEAIKDFTKAIDINPQDAIAFNNRGLSYLIIY